MGRKSAVLARTDKAPPLEQPPEELNELDPAESLAEEAGDDTLGLEAVVTDNVGEQSIEINVEHLIAELEAESQHGSPPDVLCARHKLEDYLERKRIARELADFEDFEVGDLEIDE